VNVDCACGVGRALQVGWQRDANVVVFLGFETCLRANRQETPNLAAFCNCPHQLRERWADFVGTASSQVVFGHIFDAGHVPKVAAVPKKAAKMVRFVFHRVLQFSTSKRIHVVRLTWDIPQHLAQWQVPLRSPTWRNA
jgi:hypothetical protein